MVWPDLNTENIKKATFFQKVTLFLSSINETENQPTGADNESDKTFYATLFPLKILVSLKYTLLVITLQSHAALTPCNLPF